MTGAWTRLLLCMSLSKSHISADRCVHPNGLYHKRVGARPCHHTWHASRGAAPAVQPGAGGAASG